MSLLAVKVDEVGMMIRDLYFKSLRPGGCTNTFRAYYDGVKRFYLKSSDLEMDCAHCNLPLCREHYRFRVELDDDWFYVRLHGRCLDEVVLGPDRN